ncbi:MAG TPA: hypothetical protein VHC72_13955 [Bryobacteraceae bacterium]|nr:hypothetical protein [Bryobacteraceae bacterium]
MALFMVMALLTTVANAGREFIIREKPLKARQLEGVVLGPDHLPVPDLTVSDCTENWRDVLRAVKTDNNGHFSLPPQSGKMTYFIRFDSINLQPLGLKVRLDKKSREHGIIAVLENAT